MTMMTAIRSAESEAAKGAGDKLAEARRLSLSVLELVVIGEVRQKR